MSSSARVGVSVAACRRAKVPSVLPSDSGPEKVRSICVIGGGAAGLAAAWTMAQHPDRFAVDLWEAESSLGGVATSVPLRIDAKGDAHAFHPSDPEALPTMTRVHNAAGSGSNSQRALVTTIGADAANTARWTYMNDGVQGMAPTFHNTRAFHQALGFEPTPLKMKFSFNKGEDRHWNNTFESPMLKAMRSTTRRFGFLLYFMHFLAPLFTFLPIRLTMRLFCFKEQFTNLVLLPLTALFMGTGNRTASVAASVVGQSFTNPLAGLFQYHPHRVVSNQPEMAAFPCLHAVYQTAGERIGESRNARIFLNRPVKRVFRYADHVIVADITGQSERYDDVVLCCSPEVALRILHAPTFTERIVLGSVKFYDDVTVTHQDEAYMRRFYDVDEAREDQYYIHSYEDDPKHIEMSFNLSNYQPQLQDLKKGHLQLQSNLDSASQIVAAAAGGIPLAGASASMSSKPADLWQTIFLDHSLASSRWTLDQIDPSRIVAVKWWRQMAHRCFHFAFTVPLAHRLQGRNRTIYAGSWLMVNMHEVAVLSGLIAAYQLGADYPFPEQPKAQGSFHAFLLLSHGELPKAWRFVARAIKNAVLVLLLGLLALRFI